MRNLLVLSLDKVSLPRFEVILVLIVNVWVLIVLKLLSYLKDNLMLLLLVLIVRIDKHVLIIIGHVEVLIDDLVLFDDLEGHFLLLNQEL